jgi:hypothetical protein
MRIFEIITFKNKFISTKTFIELSDINQISSDD